MEESALVVLVPEAERAVRTWRDQHDPAAALGVPAHITLIYPFLAPGSLDDATVAEVGSLMRGFGPFRYRLVGPRAFGDEVLYLAPEPVEPFLGLIDRLAARYPDTPPYGGKHETVIPHLTVTQGAEPDVMDRARRAIEPFLPIAAHADGAWLLERRGERWQATRSIPFGP